MHIKKQTPLQRSGFISTCKMRLVYKKNTMTDHTTNLSCNHIKFVLIIEALIVKKECTVTETKAFNNYTTVYTIYVVLHAKHEV